MWLVSIIISCFVLFVLYHCGHIEDNPIPNCISASTFSHFVLYCLWQVGFLERRQQNEYWHLEYSLIILPGIWQKQSKGEGEPQSYLNKNLIDINEVAMVLQGYPALTYWGDIALAWFFRVSLIDILRSYSTGVVLWVTLHWRSEEVYHRHGPSDYSALCQKDWTCFACTI